MEELGRRLAPASVAVNSIADTLNYPSTVTIAELNPALTAVTLRDAINAANNTGGANAIVLGDTTYTLSVVDNDWYGPDGLPAISSNITIEGNGAVIQRDPSLGSSTPFRLFYVSGDLSGLSAGSLTLNDLTLQGGLAQGGNGNGSGDGGGLGGRRGHLQPGDHGQHCQRPVAKCGQQRRRQRHQQPDYQHCQRPRQSHRHACRHRERQPGFPQQHAAKQRRPHADAGPEHRQCRHRRWRRQCVGLPRQFEYGPGRPVAQKRAPRRSRRL